VAGVKAGAGAYFEKFPQLSVVPKRVIAEGDLVAVHSHYVDTPGERGRAVIDLFRVRDGKIVEHWDAMQDVPETSANDNTMFLRPRPPFEAPSGSCPAKAAIHPREGHRRRLHQPPHHTA
jgi:hypothetical protein